MTFHFAGLVAIACAVMHPTRPTTYNPSTHGAGLGTTHYLVVPPMKPVGLPWKAHHHAPAGAVVMSAAMRCL